MRFSFIFLCLCFALPAVAGQQKLFQLYRTNYYTEKTMEFSANIDDKSCSFQGKSPISVYFVSTQTGTRLKEFSSRNRKYFGAQYLSRSAQFLQFTFRSLTEAGATVGKSYSLAVELEKTGGRCESLVSFLDGDAKALLAPLQRMEVEFHLKKYPLISGLHPAGVNWVRLKGSEQRCVIGRCP